MFDTITLTGGNTTQNHNITFNAVSGTLIKSSEKSKIIRFSADGNHAKTFLDADKPHRMADVYHEKTKYYDSYYTKEKLPITILQVMLCGDGHFLVEYLDGEIE